MRQQVRAVAALSERRVPGEPAVHRKRWSRRRCRGSRSACCPATRCDGPARARRRYRARSAAGCPTPRSRRCSRMPTRPSRTGPCLCCCRLQPRPQVGRAVIERHRDLHGVTEPERGAKRDMPITIGVFHLDDDVGVRRGVEEHIGLTDAPHRLQVETHGLIGVRMQRRLARLDGLLHRVFEPEHAGLRLHVQRLGVGADPQRDLDCRGTTPAAGRPDRGRSWYR